MPKFVIPETIRKFFGFITLKQWHERTITRINRKIKLRAIEEMKDLENEEDIEEITYTEAKPMVHLTVF